MATDASLDYSNHTFSARDRIEKYAEVFTGSHTLNNLYGSVLAKTLRKGYTSEKWNASEVYPNLYVGDVYAAHNTAELKKREFTHIVNCVPGVVPAFPSDFKYLHIPLLDCATEAICDKFNQSFEFIHAALSNHGRVLVHCLQGMSRSATIASAYVMKALHVSAEEAVNILQEKRGIVKPNYGFMIQLKLFAEQMDKDINKEHQDKEKAIIASGKPAEVAAQESWRRASVCPEVLSKSPIAAQPQQQQHQKSSWRALRRASACPEMLAAGTAAPAKSSFGASLRARLSGSSEVKKSRRSSVCSVEMSPVNNNGSINSPMKSSSGSNNSPKLPALQPPQQLSSHRRASVSVEMSSVSCSSPKLQVQQNWRLSSCPENQEQQQQPLVVQQASYQYAGRRSSVCPDIVISSPYGYNSPTLQTPQQDSRRSSIF